MQCVVCINTCFAMKWNRHSEGENLTLVYPISLGAFVAVVLFISSVYLSHLHNRTESNSICFNCNDFKLNWNWQTRYIYVDVHVCACARARKFYVNTVFSIFNNFKMWTWNCHCRRHTFANNIYRYKIALTSRPLTTKTNIHNNNNNQTVKLYPMHRISTGMTLFLR